MATKPTAKTVTKPLAKIETKQVLKMEKELLHKEITSLKGGIADYKAERKADWKLFKKKIKDDIDAIYKSVDKLSISKVKQ